MKKVLAAAMAAALTLSLSAAPFAADSVMTDPTKAPTVNTDNSIKKPIYRYAVPMNNDFAVDPFQKQTVNGQIYSGHYAVLNKSDVPLRVTVTPTLKKKDGGAKEIVVKNSPGEIVNSASNDKYDIYLEVVPANTATIDVAPGTPASPTVVRPKFAGDKTASNAAVTITQDGAASANQLTLTGAALNTKVTCEAQTKFDLVLSYDADGEATDTESYVEIGRITAESAALDDKDVELAAIFNGKEITLPVEPGDTTNKETIACTIANSAGALTITAKAVGLTKYKSGSYSSASMKLEIVPNEGEDATATLQTGEGSEPAYAEYSETTGSNTTGKVVALNDKSEPVIFALDRANYVPNYSDEIDYTLCSELNPTTCAGVYTIRGSVNPNVAWDKDIATLSLKYDVSGISTSAYANKRNATSGEMNLLNNSVEPTWAASGAVPSSINLTSTSGTAPAFKFVNGTKDSLIVAGDAPSTYTVTVTNSANPTPADVTAAMALSVATVANVSTVSLTVDREALLATGLMAAGDNVFTFTFTGTDGHNSVLVSSKVPVTVPAA